MSTAMRYRDRRRSPCRYRPKRRGPGAGGRKPEPRRCAAGVSDFYLVTRKVSAGVNGAGALVLGLVKFVVSHPPTTVTADSAVWGPWPGGALDPLVYKVTVKRVGDHKYDYTFDGRASRWPTSFVTFLSGTTRRRSTARDTAICCNEVDDSNSAELSKLHKQNIARHRPQRRSTQWTRWARPSVLAGARPPVPTAPLRHVELQLQARRHADRPAARVSGISVARRCRREKAIRGRRDCGGHAVTTGICACPGSGNGWACSRCSSPPRTRRYHATVAVAPADRMAGPPGER